MAPPVIPALAAALLALASPAAAQVTSQMSVDVHGAQTNKDSFGGTVSADGRYVGFFSYDDLLDLGADPLFVHSDVYLRDRLTGALERISVSSAGAQGDDYSYGPSLSADVRYAAFSSYSGNLVPGDTNGPYPTGHDVFVRDRTLGTTERVSVHTSGAQGDGQSYAPSISADGRYVAFRSDSTNLVTGDTNAAADVFVRDRMLGTTERVSVDSLGSEGNGDSESPWISADGRFVAFSSVATNLVAGDTNGASDVFLHDRQSGATERVSLGPGGAQGDAGSYVGSISSDGRYVGFSSFATNLVAGDTNALRDAFVRDLQAGTTERVSVDTGGTEGNDESLGATLSTDGRFVVFESRASNLVPGDGNGHFDTFVRDRQAGTTERVSLDSDGMEGSEDSYLGSISADGRIVAFASRSQLVEADANSWHDVYARDRDYAPMVSLCEPGAAGVVACPCGNPPVGAGRGCDNSSATGGALLSASGVAYLSQDTLLFTTSDQRPTALSIVLQGNAELPTGAYFGQGVRCAGGALKRLYTKNASGGSVTAPDPGAGDSPVSVRSAALGDAIDPGESRWYLVYYRDPMVLGGCPAVATFNATQTGEVAWIP